LGALLYGLVSCSISLGYGPGAEDLRRKADIEFSSQCHRAIALQLRDPDSASFENWIDRPSHGSVGTLTADVTVRARNGFGGESKAAFICSGTESGGFETAVEVSQSG
jgi:hypothetical protein